MKYGGINGDCRLNIFFKKYRYVTVARREYELKFFCYFYKLEKNWSYFCCIENENMEREKDDDNKDNKEVILGSCQNEWYT